MLLIGPSGCGKSTFARKPFKPTEMLSSDFFRGMVSDDETNQAASGDAFELHLICAKRLAARRRTVINATNVRPEDRKPFVELARKYHAQLVAVVFDLSAEFCHARNQERLAEQPFGPHVTRQHAEDLRRSLGRLADEVSAACTSCCGFYVVNALVGLIICTPGNPFYRAIEALP